MKRGEKGFTIIELLIASAIMVIVGSAATMTTFQVSRGIGQSNDQMSAINQVQNAAYRICQDAQVADGVVVDNLEYPNFLVLTWTEQDYDGGEPTYHSVTYFFADLSEGIGKLKRNYWNSDGTNEETLIATYIYYDPVDTDSTSMASYQDQALALRLRAIVEDITETREYRVMNRPNL